MTISIDKFREMAAEGSGLQLKKSKTDLKSTYHWLDKVVLWIRSMFGGGDSLKMGNREVMDHFFAALDDQYGMGYDKLPPRLLDQYDKGTPLSSRQVLHLVDALDEEAKRIRTTNHETVAHYYTDPGFKPIFERITSELNVGAQFDHTLGNLYSDEGEQLRQKIGQTINELGRTNKRRVTIQEAEGIVDQLVRNAINGKLNAS